MDQNSNGMSDSNSNSIFTNILPHGLPSIVGRRVKALLSDVDAESVRLQNMEEEISQYWQQNRNWRIAAYVFCPIGLVISIAIFTYIAWQWAQNRRASRRSRDVEAPKVDDQHIPAPEDEIHTERPPRVSPHYSPRSSTSRRLSSLTLENPFADPEAWEPSTAERERHWAASLSVPAPAVRNGNPFTDAHAAHPPTEDEGEGHELQRRAPRQPAAPAAPAARFKVSSIYMPQRTPSSSSSSSSSSSAAAAVPEEDSSAPAPVNESLHRALSRRIEREEREEREVRLVGGESGDSMLLTEQDEEREMDGYEAEWGPVPGRR